MNGINGWIMGCLLTLCSVSVVGQTYQKSDSVAICRLLREAPQDANTLWFARHFLGKPYVAYTLEVNEQEQLVVNTRQMDCTTLVETVVALTLCRQENKKQWEDYLDMLTMLRYRQGMLQGYTSRLHYFSDWIDDKERVQLVKEIQEPCSSFTAVQHISVDYMSHHPTAYRALKAHPKWVETIRQQEQAITGWMRKYIPKAEVGNGQELREIVRDGDIIAITTDKEGLDIAHLGFAVWRQDGLHLLNASQLHKKVVEEPMTLGRYLQKHPRHTGIRIIRIKEHK